jgi:hypothetical protein
MASSTLRFSQSIPWLTVSLGLAAAVTWVLGACYTIWLNPEMAFYREGHRVKQQWIAKLEREQGRKIAVVGGSSCATSIDARHMLNESQLPVVNLGLAAQMGAKVLTRYGLQALHPGDTLILNLEPWLLTTPLHLEPHGIQFCFAVGEPEVLRESAWVNWPSMWADLRPGSHHLCTLAGKLLLGRELYRYHSTDWRPGGWQEVDFRRSLAPVTPSPLKLSPDGQIFLAHIRDCCRKRGARVALTLPWLYFSSDVEIVARREHLRFLAQVSDFMPVLKEPSAGVHTAGSHFSDYVLHLTAEGARLRSAELAQRIAAWDCWTPEELRKAAEDLERASNIH